MTMHQNRIDSEESQSLHVLDPFTPVAAQAPSGEEAMAAMGAVATAAGPMPLNPPQAPAPPPYFVAAADLTSFAPPQQQAEAGWSASEAATPLPFDEPTATTTTLPTPNPYRAASPPPTVHPGAAGFVDLPGDELGLQQLAKVLTSLGYNEMASAAAQLAESALVASWPGSITVFAAPDFFLQASCRGCSHHHLLLEHMALGYFPYSELAAAPTVKLPSASASTSPQKRGRSPSTTSACTSTASRSRTLSSTTTAATSCTISAASSRRSPRPRAPRARTRSTTSSTATTSDSVTQSQSGRHLRCE